MPKKKLPPFATVKYGAGGQQIVYSLAELKNFIGLLIMDGYEIIIIETIKP
jgi:hypothetical protein